MSLFMGLIGGAGKGASELADQWGKERADKELEKQRSDQAMERKKTLMRLKMDMADTQRVKRSGEIEAGTKALIGKKLEGHEVADKSTWTPEMEAARNAGVADMTARAPADVAASLGYLDEAKDLQSIQASKDASEYHTRSLGLQQSRDEKQDAREERRDADTKEHREQSYKLEEKKLNAQIAHWSELSKNAGGDPATREAAGLKLELAKKELAWRSELATLPANDPKRAAKIQFGKDMGWVKSEISEFDTEKVTSEKTNPDGTVIKTERTQKRNAGDAQPSVAIDADLAAKIKKLQEEKKTAPDKTAAPTEKKLTSADVRIVSSGANGVYNVEMPGGAIKQMKKSELEKIGYNFGYAQPNQ